MTPVVIESSYAGQVERNREYLQRCILHCLANGETPYASHQMLTDALSDSDPQQRAEGIRAGLEMSKAIIRSGGRVAFFVDYGWSDGMIAAREEYESEGIRYQVRRIL